MSAATDAFAADTVARRARFRAKLAGLSMPAGYVNGVMTYTVGSSEVPA